MKIDKRNPRISLSQLNKALQNASTLRTRVPMQGVVSRDTVLIGRGRGVANAISIKIFMVQSEATGDSLYNCYEQILDGNEWDGTDGTIKIVDKNTNNFIILNLAEYDPDAAYVAQLSAGDLLAAWQVYDNKNTKQWVGIPLKEVPDAGVIRRAKIQISGGVGNTYLTCKLLDSDGNETGDDIDVYPVEHLGSNNLNDDVWPDFSEADDISCFKDLNGTWYTTFIFDDTTACD